MEILGIIPARGGSVRLPRKNIQLLRGLPLIVYSIEAANGSKFLSRTIVSTDDDEICQVAKICGAEVIISPSSLHTGDEAGIIAVVNHALVYLDRYYGGYKSTLVVLLQPTSPLRTAHDIDNAVQMLLDTGADSCVSVCQGKENGAIYVSKRSVWEGGKVSVNPVFYEMPAERSVDIDTQENFDQAERYLAGLQPKRKRGRPSKA